MKQRVGLDRLWTVPNVLSLLRLLLVAAFTVALFVSSNRFIAFTLLAIAGVTDFFDGYVARHFNQVTNLGKLLDPVVDRVVLATAVIALTVDGAVAIWLGVIVLVREVFLFLAGVALSTRGVRQIEVLPIGKAGTFGMMFAFPTFLLADGAGSFAVAMHVTAWIIAIPSIALSWAAAFAYLPVARHAFMKRRAPLDPRASSAP